MFLFSRKQTVNWTCEFSKYKGS